MGIFSKKRALRKRELWHSCVAPLLIYKEITGDE